MKKVLPLLLLAFVMCQCNFQSSQDQPNGNSNRAKYSEKFTEGYIGTQVLGLAERICNCDPYDVYSFNNVFTREYADVLKEALALPQQYNGQRECAEIWINFAGNFCSVEAISQVNVVNDNKAKAIMDCEYENVELDLAFVDGEWVIDDVKNFTKSDLKKLIQKDRKYFKSIDWLVEIRELENQGFTSEEAVDITTGFRQDIEVYLSKYPEK